MEANDLITPAPIPAAVQKTLFHRRESSAFHTPYSYEKNLLDAVRAGDLTTCQRMYERIKPYR